MKNVNLPNILIVVAVSFLLLGGLFTPDEKARNSPLFYGFAICLSMAFVIMHFDLKKQMDKLKDK